MSINRARNKQFVKHSSIRSNTAMNEYTSYTYKHR